MDRFHASLISLALFISVGSADAQTVNVRLPTASKSEPTAAAAAATDEQQVSLVEVRTLTRQVRSALQDVVLRAALDPAITGRTAAPVQAVTLEVGKDGETVGKGKLSWRLDDYDSSVDVILRGPINKTGGVALTDRGLASGASATLGYSLTLWGSSVPAATDTALQNRIAVSGESLSPLEALVATGLAVASKPEERLYTDSTLQSMNQGFVRAAFQDRDPSRIAFQLRDSGAARLSRTLAVRGSYGVGSTTFKFAELSDPIVETSVSKADSAAAVSVAYLQLLRDGDAEAPLMLISGGYTRSETWKPGKSRQICTPVAGITATECRSLVIGAPNKQTEKTIEIDIRSWAYAQKLGINPHFSNDRVTKKWTSEIALSYLILKEAQSGLPQLDSKALTVGIRVGSRPEEEGGVYASVFFGTVLSR